MLLFSSTILAFISTHAPISTHRVVLNPTSTYNGQMKRFLALRLSDVVFFMLINVKMSTIIDISTFMSMINFVLR